MKMHSIRTLLFIVLAALAYSPASYALTVQASVSKNKVAKNEVFQLRIVTDKRVSSDAIDFSVLDNDFYLSRPSFGTSISSINGQRTVRSEWNISLASDKLGVVKIPSFEIDGQKTQPIAIQVVKASNQINTQDLVELQVDIDNKTLYPNESAILTLHLIVKSSPRRMRNPRIFPPKVDDGIELESMHNGKQYDTVIDGVSASVVEYQFRLTANKPGTYTLQGPSFSGSIIQDDQATGSTRIIPVNIDAQNYTITVEGKPSNYHGPWIPTPKLDLNQSWKDSNGKAIDGASVYQTHVGESISREITLDIQGLEPERFPEINIDYPSSIRAYKEKPQFETLDDNTTRMTVKQVLIPQVTGDVSLPGIDLDWWNSNKREQQTAHLNPLNLQVGAATSLNAAPVAPSVATPAPQVKTVTVTDPGYWPYLTALFAALWIITGIWAFNAGRKRPIAKEASATKPISSTWDNLLNACQQSDVIQIQRYCRMWLSEHPQLASNLVAEIEQQLSLMNQSQFSSSGIEWRNRDLIAALKKAHKTLNKETKKPSQLAKL
ncbi:Oxygen tolerance [Vibrio xiamenensis]|uniref:Oxygen tolerance n=1 Tax=Vibrio xiamenensis TaxID=861298 RepID=A0A1G8GXD2_9VIBR|nr:BatD family protein [Vibrio xiamenensis]SDH99053.1 Oxygen tolerance [Vibrio xiamenensis]